MLYESARHVLPEQSYFSCENLETRLSSRRDSEWPRDSECYLDEFTQHLTNATPADSISRYRAATRYAMSARNGVPYFESQKRNDF